MSKTILIDDEVATKSVYALNLSTYVGTEIVERKNSRDAIDLLEVLQDFDLIITRPSVKGEPTARKILDYLKSKGLAIPMVLLGQSTAKGDNVYPLETPIQVKTLVQKASELLGVTLQDVKEKKVVSDYVPVPIEYFLLMSNTPCEVFIRINDSSSGPKYIKRIHAGDEVSRAIILKYQDSGVKNLFVHSKDRFNFTDSFTEKLVARLDDESLTMAERVQVNEQGFDYVLKEVSELGFSEESLKTGTAVMKSMIRSVKQSPNLAEMLRLLEKNNNGYMFKHCQMLSLISCSIVQKIDWGGYEFLDKLSFVSFFHDMALFNPNWAEINTLEEFEQASPELSESEKTAILHHANKAAEMLSKEKNIPVGVEQVIKQHHGVLNGIGFAETFPKNLAPLSVVFIIAESFVDDVLKRGITTFDKERFMERFGPDLSVSFRKTLDAFERSFVK
jgi:hypothetical protein